jgi:predicted RNA-binding Zn-ribbon protein involved in translation (DUF1610 family)
MDPLTCRLCGAPLTGDEGLPAGRCPNCGLYPVRDLDRRGYGRLAAGLAGIYLLTALLVLLTRAR